MTHELTRGQTGIWTLLLCSSFLALTSCSVEVEGDAPDESSDGADNDQDGAADCNDESCAADLACTGGDDDDTGVGDDDDSSASTDDDDDNTADDDDSTTPGPNKTDDDGDGQSEVDGDCDDEDPNNFTGNTELCDGQDNDCNGEVSAGEVDLDEDGSLACADCDDGDDSLEELDTDGDGVTTCSGDCDDNDASVYPGAPENWNDGLDNDCDGMVDGSSPNCFASFTLDFPDGSSSIVDGCVAWSLDATYEYDPNDPPELNSMVLEFNGTNSPGFECQVLIVQEQVCGTGYYDTVDSPQTLTYTTLDCGGVPNLYEDIYTASVGYMDLQVLNTGVTPGNFTGVPFTTTLGGYISVEEVSGVLLSGTFAVSIDQVAPDDEQQSACSVSDGDEDNDGEIDIYYGGTDCDDQDPYNFAGNSEICDGQDNDCNGLTDFVVTSSGDDDDSALGDDDDSGLGDDDDSASSSLGYYSSEVDLDGDGQWECQGDCDDADVANFDGNPEICDGQDNDCNGLDDMGLAGTAGEEADSDGDGQWECQGDCDDTDIANFDGNPEVCDGQDNDCNGLDDMGLPGTAGEETDNDSDGQTECAGDCDDSEAASFTGNLEECSDGIDNNCNAQTDEDVDADGDGAGTCSGDCDDSDAANFLGNPEVCDGQDNDCNGLDDMGLAGTGGQEDDTDGDGQTECEGDCDDGDLTLETLDSDGDGVTTCSGDCDDNNTSVYPGAPEIGNDGLDNDCDGIVDASSPYCSANFTLDFPDGSSSIVDGCVAWSLDATYEYDPNDPPELNSLVLEFNATNSPGFECQVLIVQEEVCGTGYYDTIDSAQTLTYTTLDCGGVPNLYEDIYTASVGYMDLQVLNTGVTPGNFTGVPFTTTLGGYISVEEVSGVLLSGTFAVSIDQVAPDDEQQTACSVSDGDEDDDGELDVYYGGTDCDDQDPNNFTGNPEVCDGQDNDCNGLDDAGNPGVAGEETDDDSDGEWECQGDCDDSDPVLNGLDADLDGESSCAGDCDDADPTTFDGNTETSVTCADGVDNGCDNDTNQTPVADAGADIVVTAYSNCSIGSYGSVSCPSNCNFGAAVLDGSASSDVETVPPLFTWSESSSYFSLSDTTTATPSVACSSIDPPNQLGVVIDQTAVVNLTVTDCDDATAAATVNVTCRCVTQ